MNAALSGSLRSLLEIIDRFERGEVRVEVLQAAVRMAEDSVTEHDLRDLRNFLRSAEGKLDMIRFTVERDRVFEEALKVAKDIGVRVWSTFEPPRPPSG
jgi:hypothetical protein